MRGIALLVAWVCLAGVPDAYGQATPDAVAAQLRELTTLVNQMRQELADSKRESGELRQQLNSIQGELNALRGQPAAEQLATLQEEHELLAAKVDDQYQTKVESGSKNKVKLSGIALLNVVSSHGAVDSLDLPAYAIRRGPGESNGAFGASVRQSIIGLDVEGPTFAGAKTRGEVRFDFFGGLPSEPDGVTTGFVRMRTAKLVMDWTNHTLEAGQDAPFISPLSPTSLAQTAYPALANSGNMWAWTPQVHMTHRLQATQKTKVLVQYGVMDALTGEIPAAEYDRIPTAGERSRMPAYAFRLGAQRTTGKRQASGGLGTYYSRQNWGFNRRVDSWALTADWDLPLGRFVSLSGELYRGRAIGGLGGGASSTVLLTGPTSSPTTSVLALNSAGGWAQLKFKPVQRWEFNAVYGGDFPFRLARPGFPSVFAAEDPRPKRNSSAFWNVIYQPRTNLLLSVEYRKLWTTQFDDLQRKASHLSLGAGILF